MKFILAMACLFVAGIAAAQTPRPAAAREIERLIATLAQSECQFQRNGRWYTAERAVKHLRRKYEWLHARDLVPDAERFIAHAASKSSLSGKPYRVRCGDTAPRASAEWFVTHLDAMRRKAMDTQ